MCDNNQLSSGKKIKGKPLEYDAWSTSNAQSSQKPAWKLMLEEMKIDYQATYDDKSVT